MSNEFVLFANSIQTIEQRLSFKRPHSLLITHYSLLRYRYHLSFVQILVAFGY
jgi:hypothetical protein